MQRLRLMSGTVLESVGNFLQVVGKRMQRRGRQLKHCKIRDRQYSTLSLVPEKSADQARRKSPRGKKKTKRTKIPTDAAAVSEAAPPPEIIPAPEALSVNGSNGNAPSAHNGHKPGWLSRFRRREGPLSSHLPNPRMKDIPMDNDRRTRYERGQSY